MKNVTPIPEMFPASVSLIAYEEYLQNGASPDDQRRQRMLRETSGRNVADAVVHPAVKAVLVDAGKLLSGIEYAVIGGIALGAYAQPRYTEDVDIIIAAEDVDRIKKALATKFTSISNYRMEHKSTGALIELVNSNWVDIGADVVREAINGAVPHMVRGVKVPVVSAESLIALKLFRAKQGGSRGRVDQADIMSIVKVHGRMDMSNVSISDDLRELYSRLAAEAEAEAEAHLREN